MMAILATAILATVAGCSSGPSLEVDFVVTDSTICAVITPEVDADQVDVRLEGGHVIICYENPQP